jgi:putative ABC transport system permease protein
VGILSLIAIITATPLTWWVISRWMENYPYKAGISWIAFIIAGLLVILCSLMAVGIQTVRAANTNPGQSLKYEWHLVSPAVPDRLSLRI